MTPVANWRAVLRRAWSIRLMLLAGWFAYFRLCGPEQPYFDRSWKLPDFELVE